jgi:predicted Zn-dependent protease
MLTNRVVSFICASLLALSWATPAAVAKSGVTFIRDAEIEIIIAGYAAPLFAAAGLDPSAVRVYLIKDGSINAFVAGGMNIFVYTGLLLAAERPGQLIGVIAHETGHISGGHLARRDDALRNATIEAIVACILGVGGAAASGEAGAAAACQLGSHIGTMSLLSFSRTQESSADQAGLSFLDATHQSARGILEFLKILSRQEALLSGQQDPYLRTHPLTRDRIEAVAQHVRQSPYSDVPDTPEAILGFKRMRAKLLGYLEPVATVLRHYPESDKSIEARYARAIAFFHRAGKLQQALAIVDGLIAEFPDDPYFQELKGEMLLKSGRAREALPYYEKAMRTVPQSPILRLELAIVQIEIGDPALIESAAAELEEVVRLEPASVSAWRQLSIARGRLGQEPLAWLALAEAAAASSGEQARKEAKRQAQRAMQALPEGSPGWLRAQDIYNEASRDED